MATKKKKTRKKNNFKLAIAVAQDVLKHLRKFVPTKGAYVEAQVDGKLLKSGDDLQEKLPIIVKNTNICNACVLGACFLSYVRLYNTVKIQESDVDERGSFQGYDDDGKAIYEDRQTYSPSFKSMRNSIRSVFTEDQMGLIEAAFELPSTDETHYPFVFKYLFSNKAIKKLGWGETRYEYDEKSEAYKTFVRAVEFGHASEDKSDGTEESEARERIRAIMKNIVKNKGKFVP